MPIHDDSFYYHGVDIYADAADYLRNNTGKQQATNCTRTEREALEEALASYEHTYGPHIHVRMQLIREAARKHLATLPKPEPKFRVVASLAKSTGRITSSGGYTRTAAIDLASKWMAHGCYDSVAVEQVSA